MAYVRIPLFFGTLKVKSARHMRRDEWRGEVPVRRFGELCVIWRPRRHRPDVAPKAPS